MVKSLIKKLIKKKGTFRAKDLIVGDIVEISYTKHFNILNVTNFEYNTLLKNLILIKQGQHYLHLNSGNVYEILLTPELNQIYLQNKTSFYDFYHLKNYGFNKNHCFSLEEIKEVEKQGEEWFKKEVKSNCENLAK